MNIPKAISSATGPNRRPCSPRNVHGVLLDDHHAAQDCLATDAVRTALSFSGRARMLNSATSTTGCYGVVTAFRDALTAQAIPYVVGISTETTVWAPGRAPLPPPKYRGYGRPPTLVRRTRRHRPLKRAGPGPATASPGVAYRDVAPRH